MSDENLDIWAEGVTVEVDNNMKSAVMVAGNFGRVRILESGDLKLGQWIRAPVSIVENGHHKNENNCDFFTKGPITSLDEILPTNLTMNKDGLTNLRVQTDVLIGNTRFGGGIGLSAHLGRVYFSPLLVTRYRAVSLSWVRCGVLYVQPTEVNHHCYWEARTCVSPETTLKGQLFIRHCKGRVVELTEKNKCVLKLTGEGLQNNGFVEVDMYDFDNKLEDTEVKKEHIVEAFALQQLPAFPSYPVQCCYARVLLEEDATTGVADVFSKLSLNPANPTKQRLLEEYSDNKMDIENKEDKRLLADTSGKTSSAFWTDDHFVDEPILAAVGQSMLLSKDEHVASKGYADSILNADFSHGTAGPSTNGLVESIVAQGKAEDNAIDPVREKGMEKCIGYCLGTRLIDDLLSDELTSLTIAEEDPSLYQAMLAHSRKLGQSHD